MTKCIFCESEVTPNPNNISNCEFCGMEERNGIIFKEGSYAKFMNNILSLLAEKVHPNVANAVTLIKNNTLKDPNNLDSIIEKLITITETVNMDNIVGKDRKQEVVDLIEQTERLFEFAKIMAKHKVIDNRVSYRISIMEGTITPDQLYNIETGNIPYEDDTMEVPGEVSDISIDDLSQAPELTSEDPLLDVEPNTSSASNIVSTQDLDSPFEGVSNWNNEGIKYSIHEKNGKLVYNICKESGESLIKWNEESNKYDGIENYNEQQLKELDDILDNAMNPVNDSIEQNINDANIQTAEYLENSGDKFIDKNGKEITNGSTIRNIHNDPTDLKVSINENGQLCWEMDMEPLDNNQYGFNEFWEVVDVPHGTLTEMEKTKTKGGFEKISKPEIVKAKREVDGKEPDGHVVKYVKTVRDTSKNPSEQYSEEEGDIPFTQDVDSKVDEEGKKKKETDMSSAKDNNKDSLKESFNGYRLGDMIKVNGHPRSLKLVKITNAPIKFHLEEGLAKLSIDPLNDQFELDADNDLKWQRTANIIKDTKAIWENMEKELNEGCAGGVCTIGGPMAVQNTTSGIGNVVSALPMFTKTPLRTISTEQPNIKDIYSFIKDNNLHQQGFQSGMGEIKNKFFNASDIDIQKAYDDAILSEKVSSDGNNNDIDNSYNYTSNKESDFDRRIKLSEGYESLKKLGIV